MKSSAIKAVIIIKIRNFCKLQQVKLFPRIFKKKQKKTREIVMTFLQDFLIGSINAKGNGDFKSVKFYLIILHFYL